MDETRKLKVKQVVSDLNSTMSNKELMNKYGVSLNGLQHLFEQVLEALSKGSSHIEIGR